MHQIQPETLRAAIIAGLLVSGGEVSNAEGRTSSILADHVREATGIERPVKAISDAARALEDSNIVRRSMRGRRTFRIELYLVPGRWIDAARQLIIDHGISRTDADTLVHRAGFQRALHPDAAPDCPYVRLPAEVDGLRQVELFASAMGTLLDRIEALQSELERCAHLHGDQ